MMGQIRLSKRRFKLEPITSTSTTVVLEYGAGRMNEEPLKQRDDKIGRHRPSLSTSLPSQRTIRKRYARMHREFHALSIKCSMNNNDSLAVPNEAGAVGVELNLDYILPIPYSPWWT